MTTRYLILVEDEPLVKFIVKHNSLESASEACNRYSAIYNSKVTIFQESRELVGLYLLAPSLSITP